MILIIYIIFFRRVEVPKPISINVSEEYLNNKNYRYIPTTQNFNINEISIEKQVCNDLPLKINEKNKDYCEKDFN